MRQHTSNRNIPVKFPASTNEQSFELWVLSSVSLEMAVGKKKFTFNTIFQSKEGTANSLAIKLRTHTGRITSCFATHFNLVSYPSCTVLAPSHCRFGTRKVRPRLLSFFIFSCRWKRKDKSFSFPPRHFFFVCTLSLGGHLVASSRLQYHLLSVQST